MQIDVLADNLGFTEGPVWMPDGRVALTSVSHGCLYVVDPTGGPVERIDTGGGPNGLVLGPDGALYVAQNGGVFGGSGPAPAGVQVVREGQVDYLVTAEMEAPNDLVIGPDGRLWVTDPRGEGVYATPEQCPGWLWACTLDGAALERIVDNGPVFINGLAFTGAASSLLVSATLSSRLHAYDVAPDGSAAWAQPRLLHTFDNGWPDGMVISPSGQAWVALTGGDRVDVVDITAAGGDRRASVVLPAGSLPTNVCIGGPDLDELYVTAAGSQSLLRVRFDDGDPSLRAPR